MSAPAADTAATETASRVDRTETTTSGVKLNFTAKGLIQPEITVRYASAAEAREHAVADAFALYTQILAEAADRGLRLVTGD